MAAIYSGVFTGGDTIGTSNRTATGTPAGGDANVAPTCTDNQGGTYYLVGAEL